MNSARLNAQYGAANLRVTVVEELLVSFGLASSCPPSRVFFAASTSLLKLGVEAYLVAKAIHVIDGHAPLSCVHSPQASPVGKRSLAPPERDLVE